MTNVSRDIYDLQKLDESAIDALSLGIKIPVRPSFLEDLQAEVQKEDPNLSRVSTIVSQDVALCGAVLSIVNSPFYSPSRRVDSLQQAILMIGLRGVTSLVLGLVSRKAINSEGPVMTRFWDVSAKRSVVMRAISRKLRFARPDMAQTFGLFCDIGIPLMMDKYPNYVETLKDANTSVQDSFTENEMAAHGTTHALVGAIMAKSWGLPVSLVSAIYLHHAYGVFPHEGIPDVVKDLVAMNVLSERIIQVYSGQNQSREWERGGQMALQHLLVSPSEFHDMQDEAHDFFQCTT